MPLARIGQKVLYFVHIPKNGGATIIEYMEQKGPIALRFPKRLQWSATTAQHMNADIYSRLVPRTFYDASFAVLRDPAERLKSEYRYQAARMETTLPFDDWAEMMIESARRDPFVADNHIRPQSDFLLPSTSLFRFEKGLGDVFDWIDRITGTEPGNREIHIHASTEREVQVSDDVDRLIEEYYAADFRLLESFDRQGRQGARLRKLDLEK